MALGIVSTAPFTRAEFETAIKKAMYSEGKLVWTGSARAVSDTVNIPTDVDYLIAHFATRDSKLLRGYSMKVSVNSLTYTIRFTTGGVFTISCSNSNVSGYISIAGYHYY